MSLEKQEDISREWFTGEKWVHFLKTLFVKRFSEVLSAHNSFLDINFDWLRRLGKKWIILDIDECVAPHHWDILPENMDKIRELIQNWWQIVVFSNMKESERYNELKLLWISVITSKYAKPDKRGFQECLDELKLKASQIIMIWDNYLTDWWCMNAWIDFIKVRPIKTPWDSIKPARIIQKSLRFLVDFVAQKVHKTLTYETKK